jgi:hypothetical protein
VPKTLFDYTKAVQRLIRDSRMNLVDFGDLTEYVNDARREVALRTQSIRVLTPISGAIQQLNLISAGSGYTNPQLVLSPPDFPSGLPDSPNGAQATGIIELTRGQITNAQITYGGRGYFQPQAFITDPTGSGATVVPILSPIMTLNQGQEVYNFKDVNLSLFPGVAEITSVQSVAVIFSNFRYVLPMYGFVEYQARIRNYPFQYEYVPALCSQRGQGSDGSIYVYPFPNQTYQMEWDCLCVPSDLLTDQDVEALPDPWRDSVKFYAAHLAFLELQNYNAARGMLELFDKQVGIYSRAARPGRNPNPYGRY